MKPDDAKLRSLTTPGWHFDGGDLSREMTAAGARDGRMKSRQAGNGPRPVFGVDLEVTQSLVRDRREDAREVLEAGEDPSALRGLPVCDAGRNTH